MDSKEELKTTNVIEASVHNPFNPNAGSIDAKFTLSVNPKATSDTDKYDLLKAIFFNTDTTVIFNRIYTIKKLGKKKISTPTSCFSRVVKNITSLSPTIIEVEPEK